MKTMLAAATVLLFCGLALAADKADPVGTWKCDYKIGDQARTSTLTVTRDGDKVAGTMSWPDQKETDLTDPKWKDGELSFSAERRLPGMDQGIIVNYKLTFDGDKFTGKCNSDFGGERQEWDINGKREKK